MTILNRPNPFDFQALWRIFTMSMCFQIHNFIWVHNMLRLVMYLEGNDDISYLQVLMLIKIRVLPYNIWNHLRWSLPKTSILNIYMLSYHSSRFKEPFSSEFNLFLFFLPGFVFLVWFKFNPKLLMWVNHTEPAYPQPICMTIWVTPFYPTQPN